jgi:hypothetical protein
MLGEPVRVERMRRDRAPQGTPVFRQRDPVYMLLYEPFGKMSGLGYGR